MSSVVELLAQEVAEMEFAAHLNSIETFKQVSPATMTKAKCKDPVVGFAYQYVLAGDKIGPADVA